MISQPLLEALVRLCQETAHIRVLRGYDVVYLGKVECSNPSLLQFYPGKRNPAHCTSTGQVLLAYQPSKVIERYLQTKLKRFTSKTITDSTALFEQLKQIEKQGYAVSLEELHEGVASVAGPIRDAKGRTIASVSIAGLLQRINDRTAPRFIKLVMKCADEISRQLKSI